MAKKVKLSGNRQVTSNLPIIPNKEKNGGIPEVYLYEVEKIISEEPLETKNGEISKSCYKGKERPYIAFRFKEAGNEKGENRDRVNIFRIFPIDNVNWKGDPLTVDEQEEYMSTMFDNIIHLWDAFDKRVSVNYREFKDIDVSVDKLLNEDVDIRIEEHNKLFDSIVEQFNGKKGENPIFKGAGTSELNQFVKLYLKLVTKDGKNFRVPTFVNKGFIEAVRMNGKEQIPPQIYIDPAYDSIDVIGKSTNDDKVEKTDLSAKIENDLNL